MEKFKELKELLASVESDAEKFYTKGNSAAGTRLRNVLQEIKIAASALRKEVMEKKKAGK